MLEIFKIRMLLPAAFAIISAAVFGAAQQPAPNKHNIRPDPPAASVAQPKETVKDSTRYSYEFTQPEFLIKHIVIEHDVSGHGQIRFVQRTEETHVEEPLQLSPAAMGRILALWEALRFLDSTESYQTDRQYAHLGTMRLKMERDTRQRTAEFNWTNDTNASALVNEYRRAADQAILVFDLSVARESLRAKYTEIDGATGDFVEAKWSVGSRADVATIERSQYGRSHPTHRPQSRPSINKKDREIARENQNPRITRIFTNIPVTSCDFVDRFYSAVRQDTLRKDWSSPT